LKGILVTNQICARLRRDGTITPMPYLLVGVLLFIVKYGIDSTVAHHGFDRTWTPWDYVVNGSTISTLVELNEDRAFFLTLLAISIPFVGVGILLTLARLRSAGASGWLVILFFFPVINLVAVIIFVLLPPRENKITRELESPDVPPAPAPDFPAVLSYSTDQPSRWGQAIARIIPASSSGSMGVSAIVTVPVTLLMTWLSVNIFKDYGWGVFVALPFISGVLSSVIFGLRQQRTLRACMGAATLSTFLATTLMFVVGVDGAGCLIMFLPLAIPLSWIGAAVGCALQSGPLRYRGAERTIVGLLLFLPFFLGAERLANPPAPIYAVTTFVDIDAPPQRVWQHVISFPQLPPPTDWIFRTGPAFPIRATITGHGPGSIRECVFSTGSFIEPITVWDEPRLLKFDVTSNPPAMQEWSPYSIHPPHVHDFLISHGGQFRLIPLSGGRTRLEGTTWYEHNLWPAAYWRLWSDFILHHIHRRVLEHVKRLSESGV
jgi:uncharacterized membrane protein YhaH (DUF805 family)